MLTKTDEQDIQDQVDFKIMPEIKQAIPGIVGWFISRAFPRLNQRIVAAIKELVLFILERHKK